MCSDSIDFGNWKFITPKSSIIYEDNSKMFLIFFTDKNLVRMHINNKNFE